MYVLCYDSDLLRGRHRKPITLHVHECREGYNTPQVGIPVDDFSESPLQPATMAQLCSGSCKDKGPFPGQWTIDGTREIGPSGWHEKCAIVEEARARVAGSAPCGTIN
ncbi:hypothetical protein Zmor_010159 [Zophobas morio]|uniref:Uncharacterized protein n=1 Tax=Zophobas morio TaxID=2755281 RepID=A0AA38IR70_9CUCU|nr:hypothetical protein Zmor_010159 [Zophobas morio]